MEAKQQQMTAVTALGLRVKRVRQARGWTLRQLAARLGEPDIARPIDHAALSGIENGKTRAGLETVYALAAALGVAPVHLLAPLEDNAVVAVTPARSATATELRAWIRGNA